MKTRRLFGAAVVGALALGIWFGQFFKGFGLGGSGTGVQDSANTETDAGQTLVRNPAAATHSPSATTMEPAADNVPDLGLPPQLITIVIDGAQFRLAEGDNLTAQQLVPLSDISHRATETTGTPEGIRVRILKSKNAQEGARADLLATLRDAGVKREEIQERAEFISLPAQP